MRASKVALPPNIIVQKGFVPSPIIELFAIGVFHGKVSWLIGVENDEGIKIHGRSKGVHVIEIGAVRKTVVRSRLAGPARAILGTF